MLGLIFDRLAQLAAPWEWGVPLLVLGSFSAACGLLAMKSSSDTESHLPLYQRRRWCLGFVLLVVNGTSLDLIAYSITPLAIIAPFSALTIVFTTMLAQAGLFGCREVVTRTQAFAIAVVCAGVTTMSLAGPHSSKQVTPDNVEYLLYRRPFVIFAGLNVIATAFAVVAWLSQKIAQKDEPPDAQGLVVALLACGAASSGSLTQVALKVVSLAGKGYVHGKDFLRLHMVLGLTALVLFAPLQLVLLNAALAWSPTSFAVPIYQCLLVLLTIVGAGTFFEEFGQMTWNWMAGFVLGVVLSIAGLLVILRLGVKPDTDKQEKQRLLPQAADAGA